MFKSRLYPLILCTRGTADIGAVIVKLKGLRMKLRIARVCLLTLLIAACTNNNPFEVTISRCPAVAVVGDAGTLTRFTGEGHSQKDVQFTASIVDIRSSCVQEDSVSSEVEFKIVAKNGPALNASDVSVEYFIVILKDNSQIVSKKTFTSTLNFTRDGTASSLEIVRQFIPTVDQARRYNYEILVGFQLTPNQALYNMVR